MQPSLVIGPSCGSFAYPHLAERVVDQVNEDMVIAGGPDLTSRPTQQEASVSADIGGGGDGDGTGGKRRRRRRRRHAGCSSGGTDPDLELKIVGIS